MKEDDIHHYSQAALNGELLDREIYLAILTSPEIETLSIVHAAYEIRKKHFGKSVTVHILNNVQNGRCPEDCHYCAQSKNSEAPIDDYAVKSDEEILSEAGAAYTAGAFRYCMVFAGRGPGPKRIEHLAGLIRKIKARFPIEVCVSAGIVDEEGAARLKEAGLDRLNHNLNTSVELYPKICSTHSYQDRIGTLRVARQAGLEVCSGIIAGMGESAGDIVELALTLREVRARSIPVNFLVPIEGNLLVQPVGLTPEYCLRILCLFRFINPESEIRIAAGREGHMRSLEVMSLYPANSLFMDGYLNTRGEKRIKTLRMIKDAGFEIASDFQVEELLQREGISAGFEIDGQSAYMKNRDELHPSAPQ